MILACDFDHTIYFENTDTPNYPVITKLIEARKKGHKLILWTCRGEGWEKEAIDYCKSFGLEFDAVNENVKGFNYTRISCKVIADLYIDDKSPGSIEYFLKLKI
jgi:hypothetical protein